MRNPTDRVLEKFPQGDPEECWEWTAGRSRAGYGRFKVERKQTPAHRHSYEHFVGPIPEGLCVLHKCDNPPCCNPAHLFLGTLLDNNKDRHAKGRTSRASRSQGEKHGLSKLTEAAVRAIRADSRIHREIAADYGVDRSAVSQVMRRETWGHVV